MTFYMLCSVNGVHILRICASVSVFFVRSVDGTGRFSKLAAELRCDDDIDPTNPAFWPLYHTEQ